MHAACDGSVTGSVHCECHVKLNVVFQEKKIYLMTVSNGYLQKKIGISGMQKRLNIALMNILGTNMNV